jgi:hypothetical protein
VASIGLILATSSFISGLQLVRIKSRIELKIHRFNGQASIALFIVLAVWYFVREGFGIWPFMMWLSFLSVILFKLWIVRKRRKAIRYVSWIGATLIFIWFYIVYIHIPV